MSWRDAQTLTLYCADVVPASRRGDRIVMVLACILIAVGIGMIYSGSAVMAQKRFGDSAYFLKRQLLWLAVGMVFLLVFARTDLKTLRSWGVPFLLIGLVALVAVLLPMIGVTVKGARRWLRFGAWTIQPAELVKVAVLLYLAHYLAKNGERIEDFRGFMRPLLMVGLVLGLIVVEPDLGTAAVIGLVTLSLLFIGGARLGHLSMIGLAALPALYVHHLAVDGVSWRVLVDDLRAAVEGREVSAAGTSYREWARRLVERAREPELEARVSRWEAEARLESDWGRAIKSFSSCLNRIPISSCQCLAKSSDSWEPASSFFY